MLLFAQAQPVTALEELAKIWPVLAGVGSVILFLIVWVVRHDLIVREQGRRLDEHAKQLLELAQSQVDHERKAGHIAGDIQMDFIRESMGRMESELSEMYTELKASLARVEQVNQEQRHRLGNTVTGNIGDVNERIDNVVSDLNKRIDRIDESVREILLRRAP